MSLPFTKLQAAGNGYIAIDGRNESRDWGALARAIACPKFGVGSDGIVVAQESRRAAIRMRVFNSDGSEAEISGNGLRLFAKFVLDRGIATLAGDQLEVETGAGLRSVWPRFESGLMVSGRIEMGAPIFAASRIPVALPPGRGAEPILDLPLEAAGRRLSLTCLSIGNPHAVAILDEDIDDFPLDAVGPIVQNHALFPLRINFEIVNVVDRRNIRARIFERGEGETLSSGTGSTASAIAARLHDRSDESVDVHLRGGILGVAWSGSGSAWLAGPVSEVYSGIWPD